MQLEGKVALVTGAARGIGRAIAAALSQAGAQVVVADLGGLAGGRSWSYGLSASDELQATADELGALAAEVDVSDAASCAALVEKTLGELGGLDLLVNNAGVVASGPLVETDEATWQRVFDVNVKGVFLMTKAALPALSARSGSSIVNIASVAGLRGSAFLSCYCASKFAVVGLTQSLARELGPQGVRVNAVCPGIVDTAMWNQHLAPSPLIAAMTGADTPEAAYDAVVQRQIPLGRDQTPEDIAGAALYLATAQNVTGIALSVSGGME